MPLVARSARAPDGIAIVQRTKMRRRVSASRSTRVVLLFCCHAGCDQMTVLNSLRTRGLLNGYERDPATFDFSITSFGKPMQVWTYRDATGARDLLKVARYAKGADKEYRPWIPHRGRW